jgi:predicted O-methyltransferase YrrM
VVTSSAPALAAFNKLDAPRLSIAGWPRRVDTYRVALELWKPAGGLLVETGTFRNWEAGAGTVVLGRAASSVGQKLVSIDIDPACISTAGAVLAAEGLRDAVGLVLGDSIQAIHALHKGGQQIEILYLDSMDMTPKLPYMSHCLHELMAAESLLAPDAVVMFDDDHIGFEGKPYQARRYLQERGWVCRLHQCQSVWTRASA